MARRAIVVDSRIGSGQGAIFTCMKGRKYLDLHLHPFCSSKTHWTKTTTKSLFFPILHWLTICRVTCVTWMHVFWLLTPHARYCPLLLMMTQHNREGKRHGRLPLCCSRSRSNRCVGWPPFHNIRRKLYYYFPPRPAAKASRPFEIAGTEEKTLLHIDTNNLLGGSPFRIRKKKKILLSFTTFGGILKDKAKV